MRAVVLVLALGVLGLAVVAGAVFMVHEVLISYRSGRRAPLVALGVLVGMWVLLLGWGVRCLQFAC